MKVLFSIILAAALGYFLGSLNFSIISVRLIKDKDIREMGSRNAGLTNTLRCAGTTCAVITLVGDIFKSVVAVALAREFCGLLSAGMNPGNDTHYIGYIAGFCAILGHIFPIYYGFRGGKGVLTGVAAFMSVDLKVAIALLAIFIVILALTKYVSLSSIIATAYCPIATLIMSWIVNGASFGRSFLYMILSIPMAATVIWMHHENIDRLRKGTENKFSAEMFHSSHRH